MQSLTAKVTTYDNGPCPEAAKSTKGHDLDEHEALSRECKCFVGLLAGVELVLLIAMAALGFTYTAHQPTQLYSFFRDVSIMIFFGFGFLMTFLRRYGNSAVGYTMVISAMCIQLSLVLQALFSADRGSNWAIDLHHLLHGLFCSGAVMISFGAILGKIMPSQLVLMAIIESVFFWINLYVCIDTLEAHDVGGGMVIHMFGAYFGLAVTWWFSGPAAKDHKDNTSNYTSDMTAVAGTVFLFVLWPSFQAAVAPTEGEQALAVLNTFVSLCGSTIAFAIFSRLLEHGKFDAVHLQNATLAGGVAMGVSGDLDMGPHGAIVSGFVAGALSCFGYAKVSPWLESKGFQDVCGVNNLHGMPGILSAVIGIIMATNYDGQDPLVQVEATVASIVLGLAGGAIAGGAMRALGKACNNDLSVKGHYNDKAFWVIPSDYDYVADEDGSDDKAKLSNALFHGA